MSRIPTRDVANALVAWMKQNPGAKSLQEIGTGANLEAKPAKIYYTLKELVDQKLVDYSEKRGKVKLFKLVEGADVAKAAFKGEKAESTESNETIEKPAE